DRVREESGQVVSATMGHLLVAWRNEMKPDSSTPTAAQLVGTWQLVSIEDTIAGKIQPAADLGAHPVGFLMYAADGHMCAALVDGDRPAWKDPAKPTDAEKVAYYDTFIAYAGTFKVDGEKSIVYHYPSLALSPAFLSTT